MPSADLQALVNDIAERLDAPAVLEDEEQRMIVYSSHTTRTPMDEVRRDSILRRETQQPVREWFRGFGITASAGPVRIPRAERLGILGRLCVPIRSHGLLTGFLWLIDDRGVLSSEQVGIAEKAARQAGLLLLEDTLAEKRGAGALRQLLSPSDDLRAAAARQVRDEGLLPGKAPAAIAVIQVVEPDDVGIRLMISEALADVTRRHEIGALLGLACHDHMALLVRVNGDADRPDRAQEIGCETREALTRRLNRSGSRARVAVGIGDPSAQLEESHRSYRQARLAAGTAAEIPSFGTVARWRDLGVYRAISLLPGPEAAEAALDPRFEQLLAEGDSGVLEALETYLDLCGDGQAASERLYLHRGTLYYRLKKAQRICGINLHDGRDRLAIHLAFKIARSTGRYPA
ncbi:MAG TPA: helix-turn-helix domain-containing protein [Trebonia sp.]|jgi:hypothetical protein|nr:helix-turn-helix domain-containing protein [Trebonia sp.]